MSLLTALIVENGYILARIYFIFLRKRARRNLKRFQHQIWTSVIGKDRESSYQARQILALFWQIISSNFRLKLWQRP